MLKAVLKGKAKDTPAEGAKGGGKKTGAGTAVKVSGYCCVVSVLMVAHGC